MSYVSIEEKLASYLNSNLAVKAYPLVKKETDNSCVVYTNTGTVNYRNSQGVFLKKTHFKLSTYATSYATVKATVKTLWTKLDGNKVDFATSYISNEQDIPDIDSKLFRVDVDLVILWHEGNLG